MNDPEILLAIPTLVGALAQGAEGHVANRSPLPVPTGQDADGRTAFDWIDRLRPDSMAISVLV
jgi:hypothetical protein